jgi:hypothetical protein
VNPALRGIGILCIAASLALLYPGITLPVLTLSGELEKAALADAGIDMIAGETGNPQAREMLQMMSRFMGLDQLEGRIEAYRNTRSILGMAAELQAHGNAVVAALIVTFSVIIPVAKLLLQLVALVLGGRPGERILALNSALGKWSMADVFVMAMLIAFMAGRASERMGDLLVMDATLEIGFWYFLAYCLFAIAAGMVLTRLADAAD